MSSLRGMALACSSPHRIFGDIAKYRHANLQLQRGRLHTNRLSWLKPVPDILNMDGGTVDRYIEKWTGEISL